MDDSRRSSVIEIGASESICFWIENRKWLGYRAQSRHDRIVALVEQILGLHKQLRAVKTQADRELFQRQIDATDAQIDALVYELFGLTGEEIRIVEGVNG